MNHGGGKGKATRLTKKQLQEILNMLTAKVSKKQIVGTYKIGYERLYRIMDKHGFRTEHCKLPDRMTELERAMKAVSYSKAVQKYFASFGVGDMVLVGMDGVVRKGIVTARTDRSIIVNVKNRHVIIGKSDIADKTIKIKHAETDGSVPNLNASVKVG